MPDADEEYCKEWKARFQAVGRAQARYLYVLLIAGTFYWALHVQIASAPPGADTQQEVPIIGVKVNGAVIRATAPTVLGFVILAALGTFRALTRASREIGLLASGNDAFERHDTVPTAIDFVVYTTQPGRFSRLGLLSYPLALSLVYVEAGWIWVSVYRAHGAFLGRSTLLVTALGVLPFCLPGLLGLWLSKGKKVFQS